jgi:hypothetical protein
VRALASRSGSGPLRLQSGRRGARALSLIASRMRFLVLGRRTEQVIFSSCSVDLCDHLVVRVSMNSQSQSRPETSRQ